jgi:hypothetical protein
MEAIRLLYFGWSVRVAADPAHLAWLTEFLSPHFQTASDAAADASVELSIDPDRYEHMLQRGPAQDGLRQDCFALDSHVISLPVWQTSDTETTVYDKSFEGFYTVSSAGTISVSMLGRKPEAIRIPLMRIVRELASNHATRRGGVFLHASAIVKKGRALVITGPKASGKTTLLLHLIQSGGAACMANDRVLVSFESQPPLLRGMPSIVTFREGTFGWFPDVKQRLLESRYTSRLTLDEAAAPGLPAARPWEDGRYGVSPAQFGRLADATFATSGPAAAILFPHITGNAGAIRLSELPRAAALERLRASVLGATTWRKSGELFASNGDHLPSDETLLDRCGRLLDEVPAFQCDLGLDTYMDPRSAPDLFDRLL